MRLAALIATSALAGVACRSQPATSKVTPLPPAGQKPGQMITVSGISATVLGVNDAHPKCPVRPHVEANLAIRGVSGVIQYQWVRSDSTRGPLRQVIVSPRGDSLAHVTLVADEWADTARGTQLSITESVRISYPFPIVSPAAHILAKCY